MKKIKLTALERSWILYDIGNSAFILLVSTLIPIYFNALATTGGLNESLYLSYWGYAGSVSTLLVAVIGPICGTLADHRGFKKPIFMACMLLGVLGCAAMGVTAGWLAFLVVFVLAKVGYSSSLVFYDAMLPEVTTDERMDTVSSMGYAYGYIGSVIPFILCLLLVLFGVVFGLAIQPDDTMYPHLKPGDLLLYYRLPRSFAAGEVVVFTQDDRRCTGRVAARGGDTVEVTENALLRINGSLVAEPDIYETTPRYDSDVTYPLTLADGEYFILCDAREGAPDSRRYGPVTAENIAGRVIAIVRRNEI